MLELLKKKKEKKKTLKKIGLNLDLMKKIKSI